MRKGQPLLESKERIRLEQGRPSAVPSKSLAVFRNILGAGSKLIKRKILEEIANKFRLDQVRGLKLSAAVKMLERQHRAFGLQDIRRALRYCL